MHQVEVASLLVSFHLIEDTLLEETNDAKEIKIL
jgi:hypothetical protein